jgi:signal transduction histidine kinase
LGALRLNAKRGFITLSTISREFIIAESGRSLSLQREDDEQQDPLWHGIGATDAYGSTPGPVVTTHFCESAGETHLVVSDMSKDDRFKDMPIVAGEPFVRFVACVPLRSPITGMAFGVYAVADDEVRDGLNKVEREFMHDMGLTVVDYLESGRVKRKQHCAERMMTAMGLFIEGKSTLRDSWLEFGRGTQVVQRRAAVPLENLADAEFGVQDPTEDFVTTGTDELLKLKRQTWSQSRSSSYLSGGDSGEGRPMLSRGQSLVSSADTAVSPSSLSQVWQDRTSSVTSIEDTTYSVPERLDSVLSGLPPDQPVTADTLKDAQGNIVLSEDLRGVFARASNLIRESIGLDGVVYFDANVTALCGGPVGTANAIRSDNEDDGRQTSVISGEGSTEHASSAQDTDNATEKCCDVLGFSTRRRSSLRGHLPSEEHRAFPESLMKMLLKRYPHGKVFNFDEDGQVMSDSEQNSSSSGIELAAQSSKLSPIELRSLRKGQSRESEAKAIIKVLPGARSVHWFPLWDVNRDRWFVASLVWSTSPARALDPAEDSAYLASFGNTVMAEVARLSAQELAHIKSDFISSISHELRSPLHGVLASVEFLQETDMTELQSDMVSNIHASGKVLLDTINHLLDFSKVNRRSKNKGLVSMKASKRFKKSRGRRIIDGAATDEFADIGVLSEEVIESIHAGFRVTTHAFGSPADRQLSKTATDNPVVVVVDIAWQQSWIFDIDPGALTRILMNLFSNSMKYTRTGFIKITIGIEESTAPRKKQRTSNLVMSVVDSGKGISQEFLNHQLFKPFKQEDSLASGTGLGLSIIKQIIHGLGGQIDFTSEQGTGSEARVRIPLSRISLIPSNPAANATPAIMTEVKAVTKGLKFNLEGFERYPDISEPPTGILPSNVQAAMLLKATMRQMLTDWFGMQENAMNLPFGASCTDVVVVMEVETHKLMLNEILKPYSRNRSTDGNKPVCIVLYCNYHPITNTVPHEYFNIIHIQQP